MALDVHPGQAGAQRQAMRSGDAEHATRFERQVAAVPDIEAGGVERPAGGDIDPALHRRNAAERLARHAGQVEWRG